jgi:hypothetical protein
VNEKRELEVPVQYMMLSLAMGSNRADAERGPSG